MINHYINSRVILKAENLSYRYPDKTLAIDNISFTLREGQKLAVIGPNGSGKSTLLTLLNGVRRGEGYLEVFGYPVKKENLEKIKKWVGLIFQNPDDQLFCPTIFEDVAFGPLNLGLFPDEVARRVKAALHNVGLVGYEERSSFHLSYGERKLASIATVLAMHPRLLAMDEPTSNLDLAHRRKIIRWIQESTQSFIITTHDLDMALQTCSRVILLNRGKIVRDGLAEEILLDEKLLEENDLELPLSKQNIWKQTSL
ncbi:MAG: ABC transporter ATP-binding protein [Calditrichia bacterium]